MGKRTTLILCLIVLIYIGVLMGFVRAQEREPYADGERQPEVITIWYWDNSMVEIFDRYVADTGKNVRLNYINVSISDYARQLKSAIDISNELPDICLLQDYYAGNFLDIPVWEDLSGPPLRAGSVPVSGGLRAICPFGLRPFSGSTVQSWPTGPEV